MGFLFLCLKCDYHFFIIFCRLLCLWCSLSLKRYIDCSCAICFFHPSTCAVEVVEEEEEEIEYLEDEEKELAELQAQQGMSTRPATEEEITKVGTSPLRQEK